MCGGTWDPLSFRQALVRLDGSKDHYLIRAGPEDLPSKLSKPSQEKENGNVRHNHS